MRKILWLMMVASVLLLGGPTYARAAEPLTLDPAVVHLTMQPGEVWRGQVRMTNEGTAPVTLVAATAALVRGEDGDSIELAEDINARIGTIAAWLVPTVGAVTIPSGESVAFVFSVQVPQNASPGSHRGLITLTRVQGEPRGNALSATSAVAIGIDLMVVGQPNHRIALAGSSVAPRIATKPPVEVTGTVANSGNTLSAVRVYADVGRMLGTGSVRVSLKPESVTDKVAPGTLATYRGVWDGSGMTPVGIFRVRVVAVDSAGEYVDTRYVVLLPWQAFVGLLVALVVILLGRRQWPRFLKPRRRRK